MEQSLWRIEWHTDMAFGIPELDGQHQHLVVLINALNEAIVSGATTDKLAGLMDAILADSRNHFSDEERILTDADYPHRKGHKLLHEILENELAHVKQDCDGAKGAKLWPEYGLLVRQLFFNHFLDETKKYRAFRAP
jgi:hemerythrin